jgi:hypothetical protein
MTERARERRPGWLAAALAGAGGACLAVGAVLLAQPARVEVPEVGELPSRGHPAVHDLPAARPRAPVTSAAPAPTRLPALVLPPATLRVPGVPPARVVPVGTEPSGALELPEGTSTVGWWAGGAVPGAARGTVVLAGHLDTLTAGPGVMAAVVRQRPGSRVQLVDTAGAQVTYRVVAVRSYPKTGLPAGLFAGDGAPRLVLVTCGGAFDERTRHYSDNVVVVAVPEV